MCPLPGWSHGSTFFFSDWFSWAYLLGDCGVFAESYPPFSPSCLSHSPICLLPAPRAPCSPLPHVSSSYLPYLWANEQRFFQRATVLLGPLCQLARQPVTSSALPTSSSSRSSYSADANTLNAAPPAPRFTFLPIR